MRLSSRLVAVLVLIASTGGASPAGPSVAEVSVSSSHLRMGDLIADLDPDASSIDLGPAPAAGGSRVLDREELLGAFREHGVTPPHLVPAAMRVIRKMQRMEPQTIADLVRATIGDTLPRGTSLAEVHAKRTSIPDGWTRVTCEIPRPPHKTGSVTSSVSLTFFENEQALWRVSVPVDLSLSSEAVLYDLPRGSHVLLLIRRGLVEVSASGTAGADADVGGLVPVILMPSGRVISARLEDKEHAVALGLP